MGYYLTFNCLNKVKLVLSDNNNYYIDDVNYIQTVLVLFLNIIPITRCLSEQNMKKVSL